MHSTMFFSPSSLVGLIRKREIKASITVDAFNKKPSNPDADVVSTRECLQSTCSCSPCHTRNGVLTANSTAKKALLANTIAVQLSDNKFIHDKNEKGRCQVEFIP